MEFTEIRDNLCLAIDIFMSKDKKLLYVGVNERTITHKIAEYLQILFDGYNVDCEYNRIKQNIKKMYNPKEIANKIFKDDNDLEIILSKIKINEIRDIFSNNKRIQILPDIIVHKRQEKENILVIEAKKKKNFRIGSNYLEQIKKDFIKLSLFTDSAGLYKYEYGAFILIDTNGKTIDRSKIIWFKNGEPIE